MFTRNAFCLILLVLPGCLLPRSLSLLHASYDPTRELFADYDQVFCRQWESRTADTVHVHMSHAGSGLQARSVIAGLPADVVSLALAPDIDAISARSGLVPADWRTRLPRGGVPFYSTIVFLVRAGDPKGIHDWGDLVREGVSVVTPDPRTSGGARWNYLAAWAWALKRPGGSPAAAREFTRRLLRHVPLLDNGARAASTSFTQRGLGDVLITWESEAYLILDALGPGGFQIVWPSISIKAEPPVAVVEANARRHGDLALAQAYLEGLYTPLGQALAARHHYRPGDPALARKDGFPVLRLCTVDGDLGGWAKVQADLFAEGGSFDRAWAEAKR